MKLREITDKQQQFGCSSYEIEGSIVHIYYKLNDPIKQVIDEANHRGGTELIKHYSANSHKGHIPGALDHLHIYAGQTQIAAINIDGSGHDGFSGTKLPNKVVKAISAKFPEFNIPDNNILESISPSLKALINFEYELQ